MNKLIPLMLMMFWTVSSATAAFKPIKCHTPRMKKIFTLESGQITFHDSNDIVTDGRKIASSRTQVRGKGITKTLRFEGQKYRVHIDQVGKFSQVEDYLSISNRQGHEITYPLSCDFIQ